MTGSSVTAQEATPVSDITDDTTFLFVQTAGSGTFTPNPEAGTPEAGGTPTVGGGADYLLTLEGHHGGTVYFSDRPERIFGNAPTQQFLDGLGFAPANPPNAALVTQTETGEDEAVVLELLNPSYDESSGTLTYGATILSEYQGEGLTHVAAQQQDTELPESFGRASLFIDDCPDITDCVLITFSGLGLSAGSIPGGPYGTCWSWSDFACELCSESASDLEGLCNNTYSDCRGECGLG